MKIYSKRFASLVAAVENTPLTVEAGIAIMKRLAVAKFIETAEAHIALNLDTKHVNQQLKASLVLPHGTGKIPRIAVLVESTQAIEVLKAGALIVGCDDLIEQINRGEINFDILITTPQQMPKLAKLGRILGPKGLMPSPKAGTVTQDILHAIKEFKNGKLEYRADKTGIVHIPFGKVNFPEEHLVENFLALYTSIEKNKPSGVKGKYFRSIHICSTMSPSIKINL